MKSRPAAHGVDGAWWPRSRDPATEFPELVLAMSSWVGPVRGVTYPLAGWDPVGVALTVEAWLVGLAGSATLPANTIVVVGSHQRGRTLLVVPPGTQGGVARAVLRSVAGAAEVTDVEGLLTSSGVRLGDVPAP